MKLLTCSQQREADAYTIAHESISSIDLMERAATAMAGIISSRWDTSHRIIAVAGSGNNGGDALAIARLLSEKGYQVNVLLFNVTGKMSEECLANAQRLKDCPLESFTEVTRELTIPTLKATDIIIDGLFGSGLNKPLARKWCKSSTILRPQWCPSTSLRE